MDEDILSLYPVVPVSMLPIYYDLSDNNKIFPLVHR